MLHVAFTPKPIINPLLTSDWDGLSLAYAPAPNPEPSHPLLISLTIVEYPSSAFLNARPALAIAWQQDLLLPLLNQPVAVPFYIQAPIRDPALLHLVQLLKTELQAPQTLNRLMISSIAVVLTTHLLQPRGRREGRAGG
jgi:hypothetical protein